MVRGSLHGISRYALELARRLPALAPDWHFVGLAPPHGLSEETRELWPSIPLARCPAGFLSPLEQPALAISLFKLGGDLFHATSFSLPALWRGRLIASLHDANHLALHDQYGLRQRMYYRLVVGPRCKKAAAVLTLSEFARRELSRCLGLDPRKIQVTPLGAGPQYQPRRESELEAFRLRHRLPARYFAAVGNLKAFKNLALLSRIASRLPLPIALLAGKRAVQELKFPETTVGLDTLSEAEMPLYYGAATALLLPSYYEGFGLPAVEAMACGCPVLAADAGALPEVLGNCGLCLPAHDENAWIAAARRIEREPELKNALSTLGRKRAETYTWEKCAQDVLAAYQRALA
jgi:glycosyltransferase involved in cell wall biosynthesis